MGDDGEVAKREVVADSRIAVSNDLDLRKWLRCLRFLAQARQEIDRVSEFQIAPIVRRRPRREPRAILRQDVILLTWRSDDPHEKFSGPAIVSSAAERLSDRITDCTLICASTLANMPELQGGATVAANDVRRPSPDLQRAPSRMVELLHGFPWQFNDVASVLRYGLKETSDIFRRKKDAHDIGETE